uniref:Putative secreted protein synganglion overexpressed n=1 Tax=Rhipicephalus microplus TaxID=6941 RepID=A0A6M2DAC2_RHIMP
MILICFRHTVICCWVFIAFSCLATDIKTENVTSQQVSRTKPLLKLDFVWGAQRTPEFKAVIMLIITPLSFLATTGQRQKNALALTFVRC